MDRRRAVCWLTRAGCCKPPMFVLTGSDVDPPFVRESAESDRLLQQDDGELVSELNSIMRARGSGICSFPASLLCCSFFCSTMRNNAALREVALVLERRKRTPRLRLCFRSEDALPDDVPDCWVEEFDVREKRVMLYQLA
jgi:hypothetical protein